MSDALKKEWMGMPAECFQTFTFGELKVGAKFISLPTPGDNHGHGGFRTTCNVFIKSQLRVHDTESGLPYSKKVPHGRAINIRSGIVSDFPHLMNVFQVD